MLMPAKVDAPSDKRNSLHFQPQSLLGGGSRAGYFNLAACAYYALPRVFAGNHRFQKTCNLPVIARIARGGGYLAVSCYLSSRDGANRLGESLLTDF
jgi:hypothetical protein